MPNPPDILNLVIVKMTFGFFGFFFAITLGFAFEYIAERITSRL